MSSQDKDFEEQLAEAGSKLLDPPSSVEDLLPLLDKTEHYLSRVEQSPSKSIESALSPCMKALVAEKLFKHTDPDVKVAVASCISEITRISAPEAPYNDDLMKEAFQLIVSSFEHLDDKSSRSYEKRTLILATVAKVRSCVVMLDLECDALILQMFQHFLKAIRDYHPEDVFSSMETVMTLVIEESEDISPELLFPILAIVKRDNEGILPIARKLGEKVLENCASKLKTALAEALKSLGTSVDEYSEVVSSICTDNTAENKGADVNVAGEQEVDNEAASPKSEVSSGVKQTAEDEPSTDSFSTKKPEIPDQKTQLETTDDKPSKSDNGKEVKKARKPKRTARKRGRKQSTVKKPTKPAESTHIDGEKDVAQSVDNDKDAKTDRPSSSREDQSAEAEVPSDGEKEADVAPPSPKEEQNESFDVSSPSKIAQPKKTEESPKGSEDSNDSEGKARENIEKRTEDEASDEDRTPAAAKTSKEGSEETDDAETNSQKQSSQKAQAATKSLEKKKGPMKRKMGRSKGKTSSSGKNDEEVSVSSPKSGRKRQRDDDQPDDTPKNKVKGKGTPVKEVGSDTKNYGKELVGMKVKVWWPDDKEFYEGVVETYDPIRKKHKVVYDDGDIEKLVLKEETWELVQDDSSSNEEQAAEEKTRESSPDVPSKNTPGKTPKSKASKSGGKPKKGKPSPSSVKGKTGSSSKLKTKQSKEDGGDSSEDESEKPNKSEKRKGAESSKSKESGGSKTPASKTPVSEKKTGGSGSKTAGTSGGRSNTGSKRGKKRRRGG